MENSGGIQASLSGRYATALFSLASETKSIDGVSASLASLKILLTESKEFRALVDSPIVSRADATRGVAAVAKAMKLDLLTAKFLGVLAGNRRLSQLSAIMISYGELAANYRGETTAQVTSAHALDQNQIKALSAQLKSRVGRDVAVDMIVDRAILGGLIVKIGSQMIDGSIRTKLNTLALAMKG